MRAISELGRAVAAFENGEGAPLTGSNAGVAPGTNDSLNQRVKPDGDGAREH